MHAAREIIEDLLIWTSRSRELNRKNHTGEEDGVQQGENEESRKSQQDNDSQPDGLLGDLENDLRRLHRRCLNANDSYKIAVVGLGNTGKSTLLNALLGEKIAPVFSGPCTASVIEFVHGDGYRLMARPAGTVIPIYAEFNSVTELHQELNRMASHSDEPGIAYHNIEVTMPSPILSGGLILTDTPGFGAASEGGRADDETLLNFLTKDVSQIFWVVMADSPPGNKEMDFYERYLSERCDDLLVTNSEEFDEADRQRWRKRYSSRLRPSIRIHFVEGKAAGMAAQEGDMEAWEATGAAAIEERIRALKESEGRIEGVCEKIARIGRYVSSHKSRDLYCAASSARLLKKYADEEILSPWLVLFRRVCNSIAI
jgi:GTP-binding protein EngB required for normal cell division